MILLTENLQAQIGRDIVFSADLCYNGANRKAPSEREPSVACNLRGMGFARNLCNTMAKLAVKHKEECNFALYLFFVDSEMVAF